LEYGKINNINNKSSSSIIFSFFTSIFVDWFVLYSILLLVKLIICVGTIMICWHYLNMGRLIAISK
jgi:hypothetical protein